MTYAEARANLDSLNARFWEVRRNAPRIGVATTEDFIAHAAKQQEIGKAAREAGFISLASGGYGLSTAQRALA